MAISSSVSGTRAPRLRRALGYAASLVVIALCTLLSWPLLRWLRPDNLVMVYLAGVVVTAAAFGRGPAIVAAFSGVLVLDFFFLSPVYSLRIADPRDLLTFIVMLAIGVATSSLVATLRERGREASDRARHAAALYALTQDLAAAKTTAELCDSAAAHVAQGFGARVVVLSCDDDLGWTAPGADGLPPELIERAAVHTRAALSGAHATSSGAAPDAEPGPAYVPLVAAERLVGALVMTPTEPARVVEGELDLLASFAGQIALALERARLAARAHAAAVTAETERLRSSLLSSLSHDFKTPLAVIEAAASSLLHGSTQLPAGDAHDGVALILDEARQMSQMATNILDMTRLEASALELDWQWYPVEELVGSVLTQLRTQLASRPLAIDVPPGLPLLRVDGALVTKLLRNLLENALKHTPAGTPLAIAAALAPGAVELRVLDEGPGLPPEAAAGWFDKFVRDRRGGSVPGVGLGLSICRAIAGAHGAVIRAENRPGRGAVFTVAFPIVPGPEVPESEPRL